MDNDWRTFFSENQGLIPCKDSVTEYETNSLTLINISECEIIVDCPKFSRSKLSNISILCSIFDKTFNQLVGNAAVLNVTQFSWKSNVLSISKLPAFFYQTDVNEEAIVLSIMGRSNDDETNLFSFWTIILDASSDQNYGRCEIYGGTIRSLLVLDDISSVDKNLPSHGTLHYSLTINDKMQRLISLLPQNVMFTTLHSIPGTIKTGDSLEGTVPQMKIKVILTNIIINLMPNVDEFESNLIASLEDEHPNQLGSILERRLKVAIHNGYDFIGSTNVAQLSVVESGNQENEDDEVKVRRNTITKYSTPLMHRSNKLIKKHNRQPSGDVGSMSGGRNKMKKNNSNEEYDQNVILVALNPIEINDMYDDKKLNIIFSLEYLIKFPSTTKSFILRWTNFNPLKKIPFLNQKDGPVSLKLLSAGIVPHPENVLIHKNDVGNNVIDKLQFEYVVDKTPSAKMATVVQAAMSTRRSLQNNENNFHSDSSNMEMAYDGTNDTNTIPHHNYSETMTMANGNRPSTVQPKNLNNQYPNMPNQYQLQLPVDLTKSSNLTNGPSTYNEGSGQFTFVSDYNPYPYSPTPYMGSGVYPYPNIPYQVPPNEIMQQSFPPTIHSVAEELCPMVPKHSQYILGVPTKGTKTLNRSVIAKIMTTKYPSIREEETDEVAEFIEYPMNINLNKELSDRLLINEIVLQFLSFTRLYPSNIEKKLQPKSIYFVLQFYRFGTTKTERCALEKLPRDQETGENDTFVIYPLDKMNEILESFPGCDIRFKVNSTFLNDGELHQFHRYLAANSLAIEIYDGDSLFHIGTAITDLRLLFRQGRNAVQSIVELDVNKTEYDSIKPTSDFSSPTNNIEMISLQGKLLLRLGNIGHVASGSDFEKKSTGNEAKIIMNNPKVVTNMSSQLEMNMEEGIHKKIVNRVRPIIAEVEPNLRPEQSNCHDRKLKRMELVRRQSKKLPVKSESFFNRTKIKEQQLKELEKFRELNKHRAITDMLKRSITYSHSINVSFGSSDYLEYVVRNPYSEPKTLIIEYVDSNIRIIKDGNEWRYYRHIHQISGDVEEDQFHSSLTETINPSNNDKFTTKLFMKPKENIYIPIIYRYCQTTNIVGKMEEKSPNRFTYHNSSQQLSTEIFFRIFENEKTLSILQLSINVQSYIPTKTFHFCEKERSSITRSIRLPKISELMNEKLSLQTSDPSIYSELRQSLNDDNQNDVFFRVKFEKSPETKKYLMAIYTDKYMASPTIIYELICHAVKEVNIHCVEMQKERISLILKNGKNSNLLKFFSSNPDNLVVQTNDESSMNRGNFGRRGSSTEILAQLQVLNRKELLLSAEKLSYESRERLMNNSTTNIREYFINAVDESNKSIVEIWKLKVNASPAPITKQFNVDLKVNTTSNKQISFKNPYREKRTFYLKTNRPELVTFKHPKFDREPLENRPVPLVLLPATSIGNATILVAFLDDDERVEEVFQLNIRYCEKENSKPANGFSNRLKNSY
ncbi:hypothetical protein SNEBB_004094 [Seison nebaliae]|nr:hypothetical protein SNEBB_004094 [Seison nebaliae]